MSELRVSAHVVRPGGGLRIGGPVRQAQPRQNSDPRLDPIDRAHEAIIELESRDPAAAGVLLRALLFEAT